MESCFADGKPERVGPVELDDIKRNLLHDFSLLHKQDDAASRPENLQVYLRVRPLTGAESDESQECVSVEGPHSVLLRAPRSSQSNRPADKIPPQSAQRFTFTQVFGPDASQKNVFEGSVRGLVRDVLHGQNCLLFTYGVTNAGKTFTFLGPEHDSGLLPRCLRHIFNSAEGRLRADCHLKPLRCRDFSQLSRDQRNAESAAKRALLRSLRENDRHGASSRWASRDASSLSSDGGAEGLPESERLHLNVPAHVGFSVWVSFCEIYNDHIHDLLEQVLGGHAKRTVLRLSQDAKGNSFIRDLRWVQVSSSEEALQVVKVGKKNQMLASTRLNQQSSRSHSIFSVRILRVDVAAAVPRFLGVSELVLCDLAGSERCSRTRNTGERLKEAGNINSSLLALGKCISAMRIKQNAGLRYHVPFRESKLTHFLQSFFCGAGKVSMMVNINQNVSCVDETLNVLKFSALAQKVVVPAANCATGSSDGGALRSASELSILIDGADERRKMLERGRQSSLVAWETTLEDILEDNSEEEEEEERSAEGTVLEAGDDGEESTEDEDKVAAFRLVAEARIREEVCAEFMEVFKQMEKDYGERLQRERQILEERADMRLELLRKLFRESARATQEEEGEPALPNGVPGWLSQDLHDIRADAESVRWQLLLGDQLDGGAATENAQGQEGGRRGSVTGDGGGPTADEDAERAAVAVACRRDARPEVRRSGGPRPSRDLSRPPASRQDAGPSPFHVGVARLREECRAASERSVRRSGDLREVTREKLSSQRKCEKLAEELANQKAEHCRQLEELRAELELQCSALRRKAEEDARQQRELERILRDKDKLLEEQQKQMAAIRAELELAKVQVRRHREEPQEELALVEDLREEMQRLHDRKEMRGQEALSQELPGLPGSLSGGEGAASKRKSWQVEGLSWRDGKRANVANGTQEASSTKLVRSSPSMSPSGAAESVSGRRVIVASGPRRGRRRLYGKDAAASEMERDHMIIKRQLRSKTCRK